MKNIKLLTLLWIILFSCSLVWCKSSKNQTVEGEATQNTIENQETDINKQDDNEQNTWEDFIVEDITDKYDAAIKYNDTIVDLASSCILSENSIWDAYSNYENGNIWIEDVQQTINNTLNECSNTSEQIRALWDREWDSSLKDSAIAIIEKNITYYSKFSELFPLLWNADLSEEDSENLARISNELDILDNELNEANEHLVKIQEEFAKNHGYELENVE